MTSPPLRVLVVDDDYRVASVHVGFVDRVEGFEVVGEAHTAAQALSLADALKPDLILLDIYLPDGDGLAIVRQLSTQPLPPAILVISAANDIDNVRAALRLGVTHYLVKPFSFTALAERLIAIRSVSTGMAAFPKEGSQDDINALFSRLRPTVPETRSSDEAHLAPTLKLVYRALAASEKGLSASDVAARVGISRATAQRALAQLEQSKSVTLLLVYGRTGRPEHRYTSTGTSGSTSNWNN